MRTILHPTDFSPASEVAFHHALRLALASKAALTLLHVATDPHGHADEFPSVRTTLERWGMLAPGSQRHDVADLGIVVDKIVARDVAPDRAVLRYLESHPADLIVLATGQHEGRARWMRHSVAEPIARGAHRATLFIPERASGFVSSVDGTLNLRRVIIPVDAEPDPQPAIDTFYWLGIALGCEHLDVSLLHIGAEAGMPDLYLPERESWCWQRVAGSGDVVSTVIGEARERAADLLVMSTAGHHGFLDALRGSTTEQVLHRSEKALLAVPTDLGQPQ